MKKEDHPFKLTMTKLCGKNWGSPTEEELKKCKERDVRNETRNLNRLLKKHPEISS